MKTMDCSSQRGHTGSDKTLQESVNTTFHFYHTLKAQQHLKKKQMKKLYSTVSKVNTAYSTLQ